MSLLRATSWCVGYFADVEATCRQIKPSSSMHVPSRPWIRFYFYENISISYFFFSNSVPLSCLDKPGKGTAKHVNLSLPRFSSVLFVEIRSFGNCAGLKKTTFFSFFFYLSATLRKHLKLPIVILGCEYMHC